MPTIGGTATFAYAGVQVVVDEKGGSGGFTLSKDGNEATIVFICAYSDSAVLAANLKGITAFVGGAVVITAPYQHPFLLGMYVDSVTVTPYGKGTGQFTWQYAKVSAKYIPQAFDNGSNLKDLAEESVDFSGQVVTRDKDKYGFTALELSDVDVQLNVPLIEYTRTLFRQPTLDTGSIFSAVGKLNMGNFLGLNGVTLAVAETMLFIGACANRTITDAGADEWKVQYKWLYNPKNHNKEWRATTGTYEYVYSPPNLIGSGAQLKYELADMSFAG